jgi:hypothetical protein
MVHLALQRADDGGKTATWQEPVSDRDYAGSV